MSVIETSTKATSASCQFGWDQFLWLVRIPCGAPRGAGCSITIGLLIHEHNTLIISHERGVAGVSAATLSTGSTTWSRPMYRRPIRRVYGVGQTKWGHKIMAIILSNLDWFTIFFTARFLGTFAVNWLLQFPPLLAYVATLPCETFVSENKQLTTKYKVV